MEGMFVTNSYGLDEKRIDGRYGRAVPAGGPVHVKRLLVRVLVNGCCVMVSCLRSSWSLWQGVVC